MHDAYHFRGLSLLRERAIWQQQTRTLWVADVHLGKAAAFRALGRPVPNGTTSENLARLGALIDKHRAARLVFLGDLFHAKQSHAPAVANEFYEWRRRHRELEIILVRGNHDLRAGDPSPDLQIEIADEPYASGAIEARHFPLLEGAGLHEEGATILAGHLHPTFRLHGRGRDSLRLQCFLLQGRQAILPAFGEFTGGANVVLERSACAVVVSDAGLICIDGEGRLRGGDEFKA
jgi:DNA ligase-associated metallophosphoesterase